MRSGDREAFRQLVTDYRQRVFNTAIGMVQDHGNAEDITQEVFITVFRSVLSFNGKSALSTWIYRITVNKCLDHLRAQGRQKRQGVFSIFFQGEPAYEKPVFDHPGVKLEHKENAKYLFAAIDTLPDNQRTVFVLVHVEDLPQKEVAEIMNVSVKAVESLLQRAKANLRRKLGDIYESNRRKSN